MEIMDINYMISIYLLISNPQSRGYPKSSTCGRARQLLLVDHWEQPSVPGRKGRVIVDCPVITLKALIV